ncbi:MULTISPECIES: hypothetical protein [unclassified Neptuniibacter]|uniref:hypothetical protein n=1 Tax=unclassified Neptuniibacter TaxID=2630693 RepID=UPI0025CF61AE|nr:MULTISPECIES: hypothetical protein [unclassified Neptuniibacter]|tara:strand:+ start:1561 stop:1734 length:174 start_codon:yes stop_codon:yes gene_type:complete
MPKFDLEELQKYAHGLEDSYDERYADGFWEGVIKVAQLSGDDELLKFALERSDRLCP